MKHLNVFRQLKWRIVATHMIVVIVGVAVILIMAWVTTQHLVPASVQARVADLARAQDPEAVTQATTALLDTFRDSIFTAVLVAALGAIIAGLVSGLLLARQILRPLQEIASSSQRIADGRYSERVAVPSNDELGKVATHFNQMAQALEEVEEQRIRLIGNVAHELRTPLAAISGYLEGLMDGLFPSDPETFADMDQEVRRLQRLVDDLQALSRVESGRISLRVETFMLRPVVERVVSQLRPQAESKELRLTIECPVASTTVCADPDRTAQVLVNLIGNAIHYTPEGGTITVSVEDGEEHVAVLVKDTGIGIPAEALPYLFERFYRVDASRSRSSGGSGIGLTIARHLAWAMGGDLTASSPGRGQGSTFTLTLPGAEPAGA